MIIIIITKINLNSIKQIERISTLTKLSLFFFSGSHSTHVAAIVFFIVLCHCLLHLDLMMMAPESLLVLPLSVLSKLDYSRRKLLGS